MNIFQNYFAQAELALAAYADLTTGEPNKAEIEKAGMSDAQATRFASTWRVVTQYTDPITGVSATVFQAVTRDPLTGEAVTGGQKYLAIRGTDGPTDIIANDFIPKGAPSTVDYAVHKAVWKEAA